MLSINLDEKTSKNIIIILIGAALVLGGFFYAKKSHEVELKTLKHELEVKEEKDSLKREIHVLKYELEEVYKVIESIDLGIKERDEKTFEVIDSIKRMPNSKKFSEWSDRYLNN